MTEKIRQMLDDSINDIFRRIQQEYGIEYGDDDLKLYNSDSKYKKIVDEAESIDKELREFDKKNRR